MYAIRTPQNILLKQIIINPTILVVNYTKQNTFFNKIIGYNDNIKKR